MRLPTGQAALAASARAELAAAQAAVGTPLPPTRARRRPRLSRLHIVYLMPRTGVGGGARVLFQHANHLTALGVDVTVMSHHPRPDWFALEAAFIQVPFGQRLDRCIPACDLVVAGYWSQVLLARYLGIAPVVHFEQGDFHLYDEVGEGMKAVVAASVKAADWTITVGEAAERALAERYGIQAHRVPNAVDPEVFRPGARPARRTALFVGWDGTAFKGIDVARAVAARLADSHPDVDVVWITPAPPLGAPLGEVLVAPSQEELARRFREASVYIATSRYESFPLPPLEAMASGVPVVSTDNAGMLSYGTHESNCLLAPVDDANGLAAAAARVLDDDDLAARLGQAGLATARAFSWPTIISALLERFRAVIDAAPVAWSAAPVELDVEGLVFAEDDRRQLWARIEQCPYREVAVAVSQPLLGDYRLVRWRTVARRPDGLAGVARLHLPARSAAAVNDSDYQFGIDLLREGLADEACTWFVSQSRQAPPAEHAAIGRWIVLALICAGRAEDAKTLVEALAAEHPAHADFYLLALPVARACAEPGDLMAISETLRALGSGALFDEWLEAPRWAAPGAAATA